LTDLELIVRTRSSTRISRPDRLSRSTIPPSEAGTPTPEVPNCPAYPAVGGTSSHSGAGTVHQSMYVHVMPTVRVQQVAL
jgi:hypothetical protein